MSNLSTTPKDDKNYDSDSNYSIDSLEENKTNVNNEKYTEKKNEINKNKNEEISVPFYGGEKSLQEVKKLQRSARKKIKLPTLPKFTNIHQEINNKIENNSNIGDNELYLPLDCLSIYSSCSGNSILKRQSCSDVTCSKSTEKKVNSARQKSVRPKQPIRTRGKSVSYLEQYYKKIEIKKSNERSSKSPSVCSTQGTSTSRSPVTLKDFSVYGGQSFCNSVDDDNESFYQEFIRTHPIENDFNVPNGDGIPSCRNSNINSEQNGNTRKIPTRKKSMIKINKLKSKKTEDLKTNRCEHKTSVIDIGGVKFGTLGPDIEKTKPKLDAFLKRKQYGNNVSCRNRLEVLQKRESYSLKPSGKPEEEAESEIPVPVITYSLIPVLTDKISVIDLTKKDMVQKENKENFNKNKRNNHVEDKEKHNNNKITKNYCDINEDTTEMLLQRHELEKKLAESIRNQIKK